MQTAHGSQSEVAFLSDVPAKVHRSVIEHLISAEQADVRRVGKTATKAEEIGQAYAEQVRELMGADKYEQFRAYVAEQKRVQAEQLLPPRGPQMSREELERLGAQRREESLTFLNKLGVQTNRLAKLAGSASQRLERLLPPPPTRKGQTVQLVLPAEVPDAIRRNKTNPWTQVKPPYSGLAWNYNGWLTGFSFTPTLYLNPAAGLAGNSNTLIDDDASDYDAAYVEYNSSVGFWYRMPAAGLVEVWIEAQSAAAHHHLSLRDEFGWSDSFCHQRDFMILKTTWGGVPDDQKESLMTWFDEKGNTKGYWDNHYLADGETYWAHLFSGVSYPSGTWIYINVGTRTTNFCYANDVAVNSTVDFRWFLKSVWVESTGG